MYQFANLLLLALALAGLCELAAGLRAEEGSLPARAKAALARHLRAEEPLFGSFSIGARERLAFPLFAAALCLHTATVILSSSLLVERLSWAGALLDALVPPVLVLLGAKILLCTRYSWTQFLLLAAVYFIFRWVFFNAQDIWLFYGLLFVLAAKDIDLEKAVRAFFLCALACLGLVFALTAAGFLENLYWMDEYRERWYFGFTHPNTLGGFLMGISCAYIFLRAKNWRWFDLLPLLAIALFNDLGPYVRSLQVVLRGIILIFLVLTFLPKKWFRPRWVRAALALGPFWLILFSLGLVYWYDYHFDPLIDYLNICLTGRIFLQSQGFQLYPIPIAGQVMQEWPNQDNAFIASLLRFGPVASLLLWGGCCILLWQLLKKQRILTAILFECMLAYAYFEIIFLHLPGNPLLLLLSPVLYALPASRYPVAEPAGDWE